MRSQLGFLDEKVWVTVASRVGISQQKWQTLLERLTALGVRMEDVRERFVRSSGPGGQHVNTSATAVVLHHGPSGIDIKAQKYRSQAMNRYDALARLAEALQAQVQGQKSAKQQEEEKIRRQKRRRSRRQKAKSVVEKRRHGDKKRTRARPGGDD